jgi:hypothetical protein
MLCRGKDLSCSGPDTEFGMGTITATTPNGCSGAATFPVSGALKVTIDCTSKQVCIDEGGGGCIGSVGMCYPAAITAAGFSYTIANCAQGSLTCSVN